MIRTERKIDVVLKEEEVEAVEEMNEEGVLDHGNLIDTEDHLEIVTVVAKSPSPENRTLQLSKRKLISFFQLRLVA